MLSSVEQCALRRLAIFVGSFDLLSAQAVAVDETLNLAVVFESLTQLVAKSLFVADMTGPTLQYRLLYTLRAYALEKLGTRDEYTNARRRHIEISCAVRAAPMRERAGPDWLSVLSRRMHDLRSALRGCFLPGSAVPIGTRFALSSVWFDIVLAAEYGGAHSGMPTRLWLRCAYFCITRRRV